MPIVQTNFSYSYGVIGDRNIVLGYLAHGQHGMENASALCSDFCNAFGRYVRDVILVGIAGGAPLPGAPNGDIRLGDVVVSTRVDQYDFGHAVQTSERAEDGGNTFIIKENLLPPPSTFLGSMLSNWAAENAQQGATPLTQEIAHILNKLRPVERAKYSRPTAPDVLYRSDVLHSSGTVSCQSCSIHEGLIMHRDPRVPEDGEDTVIPLVHMGIVGTANTLLKNAKLRDRLRNERHVLCVEMEAGGVASNAHDVRYLVVRGICDYADTHKNDKWQEYACTTAAAFARSLILLAPPLPPPHSDRLHPRTPTESIVAPPHDEDVKTDAPHAWSSSSSSPTSRPHPSSTFHHSYPSPPNHVANREDSPSAPSWSSFPSSHPPSRRRRRSDDQLGFQETSHPPPRSSPYVEWGGRSHLEDAAEIAARIMGPLTGGGTVNGRRFRYHGPSLTDIH